jgi:hypothetical protein
MIKNFRIATLGTPVSAAVFVQYLSLSNFYQ